MVFLSASEERFRKHSRVNRSTFQTLKILLLTRARPVFSRQRGGAQLNLEFQLAITLASLGHYGNACSVACVSDLLGVSVGAVIKSTRRVVKVLLGADPQHILWPKVQRRAALSGFLQKSMAFSNLSGRQTEKRFRSPISRLCSRGPSLTGSRGTASMGPLRVA